MLVVCRKIKGSRLQSVETESEEPGSAERAAVKFGLLGGASIDASAAWNQTEVPRVQWLKRPALGSPSLTVSIDCR
jgi:hypothetical protein